MGYLDELKVQAEQQQILARAAKRREEQLEAIYQERILPRLEQIYSYFSEVVSHLNTLNIETRVDYRLEDLAHFKELQQKNYTIQADSSNQMKEVRIDVECTGAGPLEVRVDGKLVVEKWTRFLQEHQLKYHTKLQLDERKSVTGAIFILEQYVPISFIFVADVEKSSINLTIVNFEGLGVRNLQFSPETITEELMDKMGKFIARKNQSFFTQEISESDRRRLRAKVLYEQQQREMELKSAENPFNTDSTPVKKKGFLGGLFKGK
ncbi:MAG: hypothetical protein OEZ39_12290 [Gammaproteobacteria bacterium]|nr:hypothetical protein [Gammaproteobacteria bacterium]MDH5652624.1 hypothetical protein [Gammaproteobacteria bacterium]